MSRAVQPADRSEPDLIDRIANALPAEIRADYYREMRHCRSLPENDEMLRILRAMQFLTLLTLQVPQRMVLEREKLEGSLKEAVAAMRHFQETSLACHGALDERLNRAEPSRGVRVGVQGFGREYLRCGRNWQNGHAA